MTEPRCIDCSGVLEKRPFTDVWDSEGNPIEVYKDWYCTACGIRWVGMEAKPDEEEAAG